MAPSLAWPDLLQAIEHIRPELPALMGVEFPDFDRQLASSLDAESINRVLDLFRHFPAAHQRLLQLLPSRSEDQTKGLSGAVVGDLIVSLPYLSFVCPVGPHLVQVKRVGEQDAAGRPLCPIHHGLMRRIGPQILRTAIEKVRPELPQLLGPEYLSVVAKLDISLAAGDDDPTWAVLKDHETLFQRFLQILAAG